MCGGLESCELVCPDSVHFYILIYVYIEYVTDITVLCTLSTYGSWQLALMLNVSIQDTFLSLIFLAFQLWIGVSFLHVLS